MNKSARSSRITLSEEKETLLVPLFSKAAETQRDAGIFQDPKAVEILNAVDYDFNELKTTRGTAVTLVMPAKKMDDVARSYLTAADDPLVLHLGCGLDSRVERVNFQRGQWFDLDYPEVIELRKSFYAEGNGYQMIGSSVTAHDWMAQVPGGRPALIIAEGLLMYLTLSDVRALLETLQTRFPGSELIFDTYSELTASRINRHPAIRKTGAVIHWGVDDASDWEDWGTGMELLEEWYFTESDDIPALGFGERLTFQVMDWFAMARKAHRILRFQL